MKNDAILEIGMESLPARFLPAGLSQLKEITEDILRGRDLTFESVEVYGAPMRLAVIVRGLPEKTSGREERIPGPPWGLRLDSKGRFTKQAEGFARKHGLSAESLTKISQAKGEFMCAPVSIPGRRTADLLQTAFPEIIARLGKTFTISMVWEENRFRFARPIRNLLALWGKKVVPFSVAGVRSGNKVRGLAATGAKPITIASSDKYLGLLRDACVIVDPAERKEKLLRTLQQAAKRATGTLEEDGALIDRTVGLTEHPTAVLGHFEKKFLELPKPLLLTVIKGQLMMFPILGPDGGLRPDFIAIRDGLSEGQKDVQKGYEKVVEARFNDALFFIRRDRETTLQSKVERLDRVAFHNEAGSMGHKTQRVLALAEWACGELLGDNAIDGTVVREAARLCYADLVTEVVGEFPELQGAMGGVYARLEGLAERTALALEEFYFPSASHAPLPTTHEGCIVSLAGKLDTLSMLFSVGLKPSGSEDPFGLRRLGNGIIRILLEKQLPLSLPRAVNMSLELAARHLEGRTFDAAKTKTDVEEFLWQRFESLLLERHFPADEIRSVQEGGLDCLSRTFHRLAAVHALRSEPDFVAIAQSFKRAANILKKTSHVQAGRDVDTDLFLEDAEKSLYGALCAVESDVRTKVHDGLYVEGLRALVGLKPPMDHFFEKVLVMADVEAVKDNRLYLLSRLVQVFKSIADISHIQN